MNRRFLTAAAGAVCILLIMAMALKADVPSPGERTLDVTYALTAPHIPADAESVTAWVPLPLENEWQEVVSFRVEGEWPHTLVDEPEYGNRFIRLDLSKGGATGSDDAAVAVTFRVKRRAYNALESEAGGESLSTEALERYLVADRLIPIDGKIADEAKRVAGGVEEPLSRARRLYDHIVDSMVYDKSGKGWGRGDAVFACDVRTGNCTDFHSLFIGEARALGIPARFVMGLPVPEDASEGAIPGYHCWAEFYVEGRGWIPIDASEAHKHSDKREAFFGGLDANRVAFTIGRDIDIPGASGGLMNYVIYPHVEVDRRPQANIKTEFRFREVAG